MTKKLHKLGLACCVCQTMEPTVTAILFSVDGDCVIDLRCLECQTELRYTTTMVRLALMAKQADEQEPENMQLVGFDQAFLRDLRIIPDLEV